MQRDKITSFRKVRFGVGSHNVLFWNSHNRYCVLSSVSFLEFQYQDVKGFTRWLCVIRIFQVLYHNPLMFLPRWQISRHSLPVMWLLIGGSWFSRIHKLKQTAVLHIVLHILLPHLISCRTQMICHQHLEVTDDTTGHLQGSCGDLDQWPQLTSAKSNPRKEAPLLIVLGFWVLTRPTDAQTDWDVGNSEASLMPWAHCNIPQAIPEQFLWWGIAHCRWGRPLPLGVPLRRGGSGMQRYLGG